MIKKISLTILVCCIIIACGKKGDPNYTDPEKKAKSKRISINLT